MTGAGRRRQRSLRVASFQDYEELALASGGQAIRVSKAQLPQATDVILDTSTAALVRMCFPHSRVASKLCRASIFILLVLFILGDCSAAGEEPQGAGNLPLCVG